MQAGTEDRDQAPAEVDLTRARRAPGTAGGAARQVRRGLLLAIAFGVVSALAYGATQLFGWPAADRGTALATFHVKPGELLVTVTEDGNVESASNVDVKCQVAGGSSILWIVADGTEVKQGDKLVELDSAALEDEINAQKIAYNKARSSFIQAQKDYEVAQISVKEFEEGTFKKDLEDAQTQIVIAEENLRSSQNTLDYTERMFQRGYVSELELEGQQFAVKRAQLELDAANTAKEVLEKFTKVKTLVDLQSKVETAKAALESEQASFELEEGKLRRVETQLTHCTIVAPQDGMVVYANEHSRFGQQSVTVEEGAAVRDRQTILRLPDLAQMQVNVKVHETKVDELRAGMPARINIQGQQFQGAITSIGNQPEATSWFSGNVKEYSTLVKIQDTAKGLRPGLTAEVEILVARLENTLMLPVSAVVEQRDQFFCWVKEPGGAMERRMLLLGLSNDKFVEIKDGVAEGDEVIRNPRAVVKAIQSNVAEIEDANRARRFGDTPASPGSAGGGAAAESAPRPAADAPPRREPGGPGDGRPGPGGRRPRELLRFDSNGDGKLSREEAPDEARNFFDQLDENHDGYVDQQELDAVRQRRTRPAENRGPDRAGG